jgi:hypothetical protein
MYFEYSRYSNSRSVLHSNIARRSGDHTVYPRLVGSGSPDTRTSGLRDERPDLGGIPIPLYRAGRRGDMGREGVVAGEALIITCLT